MRLTSLATGLFALLFAGAAQAETWVLVQNPDPGYRRFKIAVRTDNIERSGSRMTLQFLVVEKGKVTPQGEQVLEVVYGDQDCADLSHTNTFQRKAIATGPNPRLISDETYNPPDSAASLSSAEIPVTRLFCQGTPTAYKTLQGESGLAAVELLTWSRDGS